MIDTKLVSGISFILVFVIVIFGLSTSGMHKIATIANSGGYVDLPVIMYHSVGEKTGKYVISPEMLEEDFKLINRQGYKTITSADLIAFKEQGVPLPEKPVILTFDDGYFNNYTYAFDLLKKYDMKAVISVVGKFSEDYNNSSAPLNNNYSHLTYSMIKEMNASGLLEFANHSYNMHNMENRRGILKKKGENSEQYKENLTQDVTKCNDILKNECGIMPVAFTYPFGCVNKESSGIINSLGFKVTYGCEEVINRITQEHDLKELKRYNRADTTDISTILK